jgi:aldose 1-epimerase
MTRVGPTASHLIDTARLPVKLTAGDLELLIYPELGARVGRLLRHLPGSATFDYLVPLDIAGFDAARWPRAGCFAMLPFTNKFAGNAFNWRNRPVRVADTEAAGFLHGWGLRRAWPVAEVSTRHCAMALQTAAGSAWPWDYEASLTISLDPEGADFVLAVVNRSPEPMPAGLGFHPHFPLHGGIQARIEACARRLAGERSNGLPEQRETLAAPLQFEVAAVLTQDNDSPLGPAPTWFCETALCDNELVYAAEGRHIRIASEEARYTVVHAPPAGQYLCIEPSSHLAGRFDAGRDIALPHQPLTLSMRLEAL